MMVMVMSIPKNDIVPARSSQGIGGPSVTSHDGVIVDPPASPPRSDHHDNVMVVCRSLCGAFCVLFAFCRLVVVVCCVLFAVCRLLFGARCLLLVG